MGLVSRYHELRDKTQCLESSKQFGDIEARNDPV